MALAQEAKPPVGSDHRPVWDIPKDGCGVNIAYAFLFTGLLFALSPLPFAHASPSPSEPAALEAEEHLRQAVLIYGRMIEDGSLPVEKRALTKNILESLPPEALNLYYLGLLFRSEGRWTEAVDLFQRAARVLPDLGEKRFVKRGSKFEEEGREAEATLEYTTALKLNGSLDSVRLRLAQLLISSGDLPSAESHLQQLRHRGTLAPQVMTLLGQIAFNRSQFEPAITYLETALKEDPRLSPARTLLARTYRAMGQAEKALAEYDLLLPQFPSDEKLRSEAEEVRVIVARLREEREKLNYPLPLIDIGGSTPYALVVEKEVQKVYLFKQNLNGELERMATYDTTTGKSSGDKRVRGDQRTPEGVYFFTARIPDSRLESRFGSMAFPMNYPNEIDAWLGKSGGGIWLHGVDPQDENRPPFNSRGCVVVKNQTLSTLAGFINIHLTPIVVVDTLKSGSRDHTFKDRGVIRKTLQAWVESWEGGNLESYMRFYSDRFMARGRNKGQWRAYKEQVFDTKSSVKVQMEDLKLLRYGRATPLADEIVVAQYVQHYASNNLNDTGLKRVYLAREGSEYRILTESWLPFEPIEPYPLIGAGALEPE